VLEVEILLVIVPCMLSVAVAPASVYVVPRSIVTDELPVIVNTGETLSRLNALLLVIDVFVALSLASIHK
jgi:hypothetical protein